MGTPSPLFDVSIWLERADDPDAVHDALVQALGEQTPLLARGVRVTDNGVLVEFPEMKATSDLGGGAPAQMERVLPVVRALIALSAARVEAGLAPSERVVIEVKPSGVHPQDELRHA